MATRPFTTPPMPAVARILSRYDRPKLEAFLSVAIDLLDTMDGDTDWEAEDPASETIPIMDDPDGDELNEGDGDTDLESVGAEDDFEYPRSSSLLPNTARAVNYRTRVDASTMGGRRRWAIEAPFTRSSPYPR